jgi:hypothetical protein
MDMISIDLDKERMAVERLHAAWQEERQRKQALLAECAANHTSPGPNYWEAEARARAKYTMAANFVEMLEKAKAKP